jgi:flagellar protein FlgJ
MNDLTSFSAASQSGAYSGTKIRNLAQLQKQAEDFEAVFIGKLVNIMFDTVAKGDLSGSHAEETFQGMLGERIGDALAEKGGFGLAQPVLDQLIKLQENVHE